MAVLVLVRHGHSTANADGVLAGWTPDVHLTSTGREQAADVAGQLAGIPVQALYVSPVLRAVQTAQIIGEGLNVAAVEDVGLGECRYGAWTGRSLAELRDEPLWRTVQDDPAHASFPPGDYPSESLTEMTDRLMASVRRLDSVVEQRAGADAVWVAVSHGDPIKAVLAVAGGADVSALQRHHVDPGALCVVRFAGERAIVLAANCRTLDLPRLVGATAAPTPGEAAVGGGAG
ncbi:MAG: MSMEG_4193 family putative phosphomutase [Phycicoccus sp.]|nr:MSMEG_4193 family putative phosphomutase [Phycicoccus sp.]